MILRQWFVLVLAACSCLIAAKASSQPHDQTMLPRTLAGDVKDGADDKTTTTKNKTSTKKKKTSAAKPETTVAKPKKHDDDKEEDDAAKKETTKKTKTKETTTATTKVAKVIEGKETKTTIADKAENATAAEPDDGEKQNAASDDKNDSAGKEGAETQSSADSPAVEENTDAADGDSKKSNEGDSDSDAKNETETKSEQDDADGTQQEGDTKAEDTADSKQDQQDNVPDGDGDKDNAGETKQQTDSKEGKEPKPEDSESSICQEAQTCDECENANRDEIPENKTCAWNGTMCELIAKEDAPSKSMCTNETETATEKVVDEDDEEPEGGGFMSGFLSLIVIGAILLAARNYAESAGVELPGIGSVNAASRGRHSSRHTNTETYVLVKEILLRSCPPLYLMNCCALVCLQCPFGSRR